MTQHEYIFVAISIILGLAITRMLHNMAILIRAHREVTFHWSTAVWGICVMIYCLQLWWVGWGLRDLGTWSFGDFAVLIVGSICLYGAAEMALPVPEGSRGLNFLQHSKGLGRLSALSLLFYFAIGPYVNITLFGNDIIPSLVLPITGAILTGLIIRFPDAFEGLSLLFLFYTAAIISVTA